MLIGDIYRKLYGLIFSRPTNFKWLKDNQMSGDEGSYKQFLKWEKEQQKYGI